MIQRKTRYMGMISWGWCEQQLAREETKEKLKRQESKMEHQEQTELALLWILWHAGASRDVYAQEVILKT